MSGKDNVIPHRKDHAMTQGQHPVMTSGKGSRDHGVEATMWDCRRVGLQAA